MAEKRHYNVEHLHDDYRKVFALMMKITAVGIVGALIYFFVFIVYLGGTGHTKADGFTKDFVERYPIDYSGLKTPEFGGPAHPVPAHHE